MRKLSERENQILDYLQDGNAILAQIADHIGLPANRVQTLMIGLECLDLVHQAGATHRAGGKVVPLYAIARPKRIKPLPRVVRT